MFAGQELTSQRPREGVVLTKAVLRAAERLDVPAKSLSGTLGLSEATLSRMRKGDFLLEQGTKPFELAVLFIRLFRSLDAIVGGDEKIARSWMVNVNTALDGRPVDKIKSVAGLVDVIAYLDARRALV